MGVRPVRMVVVSWPEVAGGGSLLAKQWSALLVIERREKDRGSLLTGFFFLKSDFEKFTVVPLQK